MAGARPANGINRVAGISGGGSGSTACEPASIEVGASGFGSAGEVPAVISDFDPRVISGIVRPQRSADEAGGDANGATGVDEQDR